VSDELVGIAAVLRDEVDCDPVVPVFVDHAQHGQVRFVKFETWLVCKRFAGRAFPLCAGDAVEAAVAQTLDAHVAHGALNLVEVLAEERMLVGQALFIGGAAHG
jgi:hypothetical protein